MESVHLREFATRYTAAWCSQNPDSVAGFFAEGGSLKINEAPPTVGRAAIAEDARSFMTALPDMVLTMDGISVDGNQVIYRWTLSGTNNGPGGTGNKVLISGYEEWTIGEDGLIVESRGHFDEAEYARQLNIGVEGG
jgi:predicted ester cyclase